jgi:hypothetical protein
MLLVVFFRFMYYVVPSNECGFFFFRQAHVILKNVFFFFNIDTWLLVIRYCIAFSSLLF